MDIFLEYIVKKAKSPKDLAINIGIILGAIVLMFLILVVIPAFVPFLGTFTLLFLAAIIYGAWFLINSRNIEFEYIVTNGEIDVDKIIARKRRKRLITVNSRNFEIMAKVSDPNYKAEFTSNLIEKRITAASSPDAKDAYFAVFTKDGQKHCLIFEPTEKMLNSFRASNPRKIII